MLRLLLFFLTMQAFMGYWIAQHGTEEAQLVYAVFTTFLCLLIAIEVAFVIQPKRTWERARGLRTKARIEVKEPADGQSPTATIAE